MQLVIDANVLIAAFLKEATTRRLIFDERLNLIAPEHLLIETKKVLSQPRILKRLNLSPKEMNRMFSLLGGQIEFMPHELYISEIDRAKNIAAHIEDASYVALALKTASPIWSNDMELSRQPHIHAVSTSELIELLKP